MVTYIIKSIFKEYLNQQPFSKDFCFKLKVYFVHRHLFRINEVISIYFKLKKNEKSFGKASPLLRSMNIKRFSLFDTLFEKCFLGLFIHRIT